MSVTQPIPPTGQAGIMLLLCCGLCLLFASLMLGPVSVIVFVVMTTALKTYRSSHKILAVLIITLLPLFLIFASQLDWTLRFEILLAIFATDDGWSIWLRLWHLTPDVFIGGSLMAALLKGASLLWWRSPFRQIKRKKQGQHFDRSGVRNAKRALGRINAKPASYSQSSRIGVEQTSGQALCLEDKALNTHMLIAGTTGSGKTVSLLNCVESYIDRNLPVLFLDGKGDLELASHIQSYARFKQRPFWHFSLVGPSCCYNPLQGDYTALKDKVIALRREWSEEHYLKLAEGYLQTVFKIMQTLQVPLTLGSVCHALDLDVLTGEVREAAHKGQLTRNTAQELLDALQHQEDASKHVLSLQAELRNLASSSFGPLFETTHSTRDNHLNLRTVLKRRGVACLSLSPMLYPESSGVVGRLLLNDLKSSLDPLHPQKVLLVIDEVSTLVSPILLNLLNQGRFLGLHIILTIQSIADLGQKIATNPELFIRQILANCNIFLIHKLNDPDDAETIAALLGTRSEIEHTAQVAEFGFGTGLGTARLVHEYFAHPDQIKSLSRGQAFLLDKNEGHKPRLILCRKSLLID